MIILHPQSVLWLGVPWPDVQSVIVDRSATRELAEHDDVGRHQVFADVPESRCEVTVTRTLELTTTMDTPRPGDASTLWVTFQPNGSDARRYRFAVNATVLSVKTTIGEGKAVRVVKLVAVSTNGATDPVYVEALP